MLWDGLLFILKNVFVRYWPKVYTGLIKSFGKHSDTFSLISFLLNIKINDSCLEHLEEDCTYKQRDIHIYIFIYYTHVNIYTHICIYTYTYTYILICNTTYPYKTPLWSRYISGSKISRLDLHPGPPFNPR